MPTAKQPPLEGHQPAKAACAKFAAAKKRLLARVQLDTLTPREATKRLQQLHEKLLKAYLRSAGTTYAAWLEHGPRGELDEVLEASRDVFVFENLAERYAARSAQ